MIITWRSSLNILRAKARQQPFRAGEGGNVCRASKVKGSYFITNHMSQTLDTGNTDDSFNSHAIQQSSTTRNYSRITLRFTTK